MSPFKRTNHGKDDPDSFNFLNPDDLAEMERREKERLGSRLPHELRTPRVRGRQSKKEKVHLEMKWAREGRSYIVRHPETGAKTHVSDGWVPATVLEKLAGWRFGARLYDLKEDGILTYESKELYEGLWLYRAHFNAD